MRYFTTVLWSVSWNKNVTNGGYVLGYIQHSFPEAGQSPALTLVAPLLGCWEGVDGKRMFFVSRIFFFVNLYLEHSVFYKEYGPTYIAMSKSVNSWQGHTPHLSVTITNIISFTLHLISSFIHSFIHSFMHSFVSRIVKNRAAPPWSLPFSKPLSDMWHCDTCKFLGLEELFCLLNSPFRTWLWYISYSLKNGFHYPPCRIVSPDSSVYVTRYTPL